MRKRGVRKLAINLQLPPEVWARFKQLVEPTGTSINYCMERVLCDIINRGEIPGLAPIEQDEARENEKYGAATPVYDGQQNKRRLPTGRVEPSAPAQ